MIDITGLWRSAHPHLRPFRDHLPLPDRDMPDCPACGGQGTLSVGADCRPAGSDLWLRDVRVVYCPGCDSFHLDPAALPPEGVDSGIAEVSGRLWSAAPTFLNIEPTTRCNFRCWYCIGRHMRQEDIAVSDFMQVLDHAPAIRTIALTGEGEPLLHPGFFDMARAAVARGIKIVMISNGSRFSDDTIRQLCETPVRYVAISIDSTRPEEFTRSRPPGDLSEVLRGIARLRSFRDRHGCRYPAIGVKGTLFDYSEHELLAIVRLAKEHGAEIFESFQPLNPKDSYVAAYPEAWRGQLALAGRIAGTIAADSSEARRILRPVEEFCQEEEIDFGGAGRMNLIRPNCDERHLYSLLSGDVTPCCQIKQPLSPAWNIIARPLDEVLSDSAYENIRFNLWNGIFPAVCTGCWKTRRPGCRRSLISPGSTCPACSGG
jgi:MoaA/NifB/PqqE/SkfB family radical SAM enzyme